MRHFYLTTLFLFFVIPHSLFAEVRIVGQGGNYNNIQAAIDASVDGDVILVRPGAYARFTLDKGVMISASSTPFLVLTQQPIVISGIAEGQKAGISGMIIREGWNGDHILSITDCTGEVIIEDTQIGAHQPVRTYPGSPGTVMVIENSFNVSLNSVENERGEVVNFTTPGFHSPAALEIRNSSVRLADCTIQGANGYMSAGSRWDIVHGEPAVHATAFSNLVVARSVLSGGHGAPYDSQSSGNPEAGGGDGGQGLLLSSFFTNATILGTANDLIQGGDGGPGHIFVFPGGDGGNGLEVVGTASALVSRVTLQGGLRGGPTAGSPGEPFTGPAAFDHRLPYTDMGGTIAPGGALAIDVQGNEPGLALLLLSGKGGFFSTGNWTGPPLSAIPGQWFFFESLGRNNGMDPLHYSFPLMDHPIIQGIAFNAQSVVISDSGEILMGNCVTRIAGE